MKKSVAKSDPKRRKAAQTATPPAVHGAPVINGRASDDQASKRPAGAESAPAPRATNGQPEPAIVGDGRLPSSMMRSYALLTPDLKELYFKFYRATYGKTKLDLKTKEFIAIAASLSHNCKGCLEGHLRKAKKEGATAEEISEVIAVTLGVAAAAIVDRSDIANFHLGGLYEKPSESPE